MAPHKKITSLTLDDYAKHPVWSWADEDEDTVMPVDCATALPEDFDAVFVRADLTFNDGTRVTGVISVATGRDLLLVYVIDFAQNDGRLHGFSLHPSLVSPTVREEIAAWLGKTVTDVFPIRYSTTCVFQDGQRISGEIA